MDEHPNHPATDLTDLPEQPPTDASANAVKGGATTQATGAVQPPTLRQVPTLRQLEPCI